MKRIEVQVLLMNPETGEPKLYTIPGYLSSVAGLVVHKSPLIEGDGAIVTDGWNVTHQATGLVLPWGAGYDRMRDAEEYARACGEVADWTLTTQEEVRNSAGKAASIMVNKHNEIVWR